MLHRERWRVETTRAKHEPGQMHGKLLNGRFGKTRAICNVQLAENVRQPLITGFL